MTYPARSDGRGLVGACAWLAAFCVLAPVGARAEPDPAPAPPPAEPAAAPTGFPAPPQSPLGLRALEETAPVTFRDSAKTTVTLRVPLALHRPANAFRLYGNRPLTLHARARR